MDEIFCAINRQPPKIVLSLKIPFCFPFSSFPAFSIPFFFCSLSFLFTFFFGLSLLYFPFPFLNSFQRNSRQRVVCKKINLLTHSKCKNAHLQHVWWPLVSQSVIIKQK